MNTIDGDFRVEVYRSASIDGEMRAYYALVDNRSETLLPLVDWSDDLPFLFETEAQAAEVAQGLNTGTYWLCEVCCRPIPIPDVVQGEPAGLICDDCAQYMEAARLKRSQEAWVLPQAVGATRQRGGVRRPTHTPEQPSLFDVKGA